MKISKDEFVGIINQVKEVESLNDDLNNFFKKKSVDGCLFLPNCCEHTVRLMRLLCNDTEDWIAYFCYELDFGKKWKSDTIKDANGKEIKLETPEDLYDLLLSYE